MRFIGAEREAKMGERWVQVVPFVLFTCLLSVSSATTSDGNHKHQGREGLWRRMRLDNRQGVYSDISETLGDNRNGLANGMDLTTIKRVMNTGKNQDKSRKVSVVSETIRDDRGFRRRPAIPESLIDDLSERLQSNSPGTAGIQGTLSEQGLEYVKEVLVNQILDEVTPLKIPDINTRVNSPVGRVDAAITGIVLSGAEVPYSTIDLGQTGVTIYASGIKASLAMDWKYEYTASYIPFPVIDVGQAQVKVIGMQAGATLSLSETNGTLRLVVEECGTYIEDLKIELHGGASWLYQWFVYVFDYQIRSAIELQITQQIVSGAEQLDSWLLDLPRRVPIDDTSAIDVTVVQGPLVSPTFLSVGAKGEFVSLNSPKEYPQPDTQIRAGLFCDQSVKMLTIALSDYVLNSAGFVYYDSGYLQWDVDELPGRKYLNTASWKYIIPQLYKKYPNEDMVLNFAVSGPPKVDLSRDGISAIATVDMTIKVDDGKDLVPVACINLMVSMDAIGSLEEGNITAEATLKDLTVAMKWSEVGNFPVYLVQATVRTIVKDVVIPLLNLNLRRGFPLPVVAGVTLENSDLRYEDGYLLVCTDIHYKGGFIKELKKPNSIVAKYLMDQ